LYVSRLPATPSTKLSRRIKVWFLTIVKIELRREGGLDWQLPPLMSVGWQEDGWAYLVTRFRCGITKTGRPCALDQGRQTLTVDLGRHSNDRVYIQQVKIETSAHCAAQRRRGEVHKLANLAKEVVNACQPSDGVMPDGVAKAARRALLDRMIGPVISSIDRGLSSQHGSAELCGGDLVVLRELIKDWKGDVV
jgi:hypothetical protein